METTGKSLGTGNFARCNYLICIILGVRIIPIGSLAVPFWDYLIGFYIQNHKKELLRSLWVIRIILGVRV